jgi:hypothetical protein
VPRSVAAWETLSEGKAEGSKTLPLQPWLRVRGPELMTL